MRHYSIDNQPKTLNTDKHSSYANAIARLKKEGRLREDVEQRQVKYLNNGIESDHAPIKKLIVAPVDLKYENVHGQRFRDLIITDVEQRPI